jgi:hypothetical protein
VHFTEILVTIQNRGQQLGALGPHVTVSTFLCRSSHAVGIRQCENCFQWSRIFSENYPLVLLIDTTNSVVWRSIAIIFK